MKDRQSLTQEQTLALRLTPQQLRFVQLLEMNASELDEAVDREIEANPALDEADPAERPAKDTPDALPPSVYSPRGALSRDDDAQPQFADDARTLYDVLDEQLGALQLPEDVMRVARYIVASLDGNGYLRRELRLLVDDMAFNHGINTDMETAGKALHVVQGLEPHGVGATSLQESLELQLRALHESQTRDDALRVVTEQFDAFSMKHYHRIVSALAIGKERVNSAVALILKLNPKPGAAAGGSDSSAAGTIVPDILLERDQTGEWSIVLNNRFPELAVQRSFAQAAAEMEVSARKRGEQDQAREFVMANFNDARDFIRIVQQRQKTLSDVMTAIVTLQKDYFASEDVYDLRPMMLKDISALTGLDMSVISRATAGKYVATPWGTFPLRFFFSDSKGAVGTPGPGTAPALSDGSGNIVSGAPAPGEAADESPENAITNRKIEARIQQLVDEEDKKRPMSDEKIRQAMAVSGFDLSRRTVAKYRDRIGIPVARLRKTL